MKRHLQTDFIQFLLEKERIQTKTSDKDKIEETGNKDKRKEITDKKSEIKDDEDYENGENAENIIEKLITQYNQTKIEYENLFGR